MTEAFDSDVDLEVSVAWGNDPFDASPTWDDITAYVRGFAVDRGRSAVFERMKAGTGTLILDNSDRRFDPLYGSSPYSPDVKPLKPVRIRATYNLTTYPIFQGYVESITQQWPLSGHDAVCTMRIVDGFSLMARAEVTSTEVQEDAGTRLGNILDDIGWPSGASWRDLDTGTFDMVAVTMDCNSALIELHRVADSDGGTFFISKDGKATYQDSSHRSGLSSSATYGDGPSGEAKYYRQLLLEYDDTQLWNRVEINRWGAAATVASEDATSVAAYGTRIRQFNDLLLVDDSDAGTLADTYRDRFKDPGVRFQNLEIHPRGAPSDLWPEALGRDISDKVTVERNPPGSGSISQDVFIEGISHRSEASGQRWATLFRTSNVTY